MLVFVCVSVCVKVRILEQLKTFIEWLHFFPLVTNKPKKIILESPEFHVGSAMGYGSSMFLAV